MDIIAVLEEIGLTRSEIKVYLALLETGNATTGKIVETAQVASGKIYEILEKLIRKGLVSSSIQSGTKHFEAATPQRLLDYVAERENHLLEQKAHLQQVLPSLLLRRNLAKHRAEATTFRGLKGAKTAFDDILQTMRAGETYFAFGVTEPTNTLGRFLKHYHQQRSEKGIKVKLLFTEQGRNAAEAVRHFPHTEIRFAPVQLFASSFVLVYKHKTLIVVSTKEEPLLFRIENKEVADSFRSQFELLWEQRTQVLRGLDAVRRLFDDMLRYKHADFIGARGYLLDRDPAYVKYWEEQAAKSGFTMRNIVDPQAKGSQITKFSFAQTRYTLEKEFSQLSVFWIYGGKVVISNWMDKEPLLIVIENRNLYRLYKKQFELLWKKKLR